MAHLGPINVKLTNNLPPGVWGQGRPSKVWVVGSSPQMGAICSNKGCNQLLWPVLEGNKCSNCLNCEYTQLKSDLATHKIDKQYCTVYNMGNYMVFDIDPDTFDILTPEYFCVLRTDQDDPNTYYMERDDYLDIQQIKKSLKDIETIWFNSGIEFNHNGLLG